MSVKTVSQLYSSQEKDMLEFRLEAALTKHVKDWLDIQSDISYHKVSDRFKSGIPDILACVSGMYVAIELKAKDGVVSPHQEIFIRNAIKTGGIGGICTTLGQVKALVEQARNKASRSNQ